MSIIINSQIKNHKKLHFDIQTSDIKELLTSIVLNPYNNITCNDIKDINDKEKVILSLFINKLVHTNPIVSKYNLYKIYLYDKELLQYKPLFRGFYICIDILSYIQKLMIGSVLNIGILPTFLESLLYGDASIHCSFIKIKNYKKNIQIYFDLIKQFNNIYPNVSINEFNFYNNTMQSILSYINNNYDMIIFDTYKHLFNFDYSSIKFTINQRLLSSYLQTTNIFKQFVFAINRLNNNGTLIMLLPGFENNIYQQIIVLTGSLFNNVQLIHSSIDFSFRIFLIATGFKKNDKIINELTQIINKLNNESILINLLKSNQKQYYTMLLINKFNLMKQKISQLSEFMINNKLIKKIYKDLYFIQLTQTFDWLTNKLNNINQEIYDYIYQYKTNIIKKLKKFKNYYYNLSTSIETPIQFVNKNISINEFDRILPIHKFIKLFDLLCYDETYQYQQYKNIKRDLYNKKYDDSDAIINDIEYIASIINESKQDSIILSDDNEIKKQLKLKTGICFIDWNFYLSQINTINLFSLNLNSLIIKFEIKHISPLFVSYLFLLTNIYDSVNIIKTMYDSNYYVLCYKIKQEQIINIIKKMINKTINTNYYITAMTSDFILNISHIFNKLIINELIDAIRIKYYYKNPNIDYI